MAGGSEGGGEVGLERSSATMVKFIDSLTMFDTSLKERRHLIEKYRRAELRCSGVNQNSCGTRTATPAHPFFGIFTFGIGTCISHSAS